MGGWMSKYYGGRLSLAVIVGICCFIADQSSKNWAMCNLSQAAYKPFIPGFLRLTLVTNTGGAFGVGCGNNIAMTLLAGAIMIGILGWVLWRERSGQHLSVMQWCGAGFLIGGAFGNFWDRLMLGHVIDFLDFAFINFPVFNASDVFVDIGIGLILLSKVFSK
jgi:signal peptidase II